MQIFVAMPIGKPVPGIREAIRSAAVRAQINCIFPDEINKSGEITIDIIEEIRKSSAVIVEITDRNPNVIWEFGYASAIGKRIIPISQSKEAIFLMLQISV